jgi:hypothetical protein
MKETICAILARNNFDRKQALAYCKSMARDYPRLREEYKLYILALRLGNLLGR